MIRATDIHSLTEFTRNAKKYIGQIKASGHPVVITVNGEAEVVVVSAEEYQALQDQREQTRYRKAVQEGLEDVDADRLVELDTAFDQIEKRLGS